MATLSTSGLLTYSDFKRQTNADGTAATVAEILTQRDQLRGLIPYEACNDGNQHHVWMRSELPTADLIGLNEGVILDKGSVTKITEATAKVGVGHQIKAETLGIVKNPEAHRAVMASAQIIACGHKEMNLWWYGDPATDRRAYRGLATRYNSLSGEIGKRVKSAGGSDAAHNTSIYGLVLGGAGVHGIVPDTQSMGIQRKESLPMTVTNAAGRVEDVITETWTMHTGLALENLDAVYRICNINSSTIPASGSAASALWDYMTELYCSLNRASGLGRPVICVPQSIYMALDKGAQYRTSAQLTSANVDGVPYTMYRDIPVLVCDSISTTEAVVS